MNDKEKFKTGMVQIKVRLPSGETRTRWITPEGPDLFKGIRDQLAWNEALVGYDTGQRQG